MGLLRNLIFAVVPRGLAQAMEADSRAWMLQCPCGAEISIWDIGGIRYKAVGESRDLYRCARCGKRTWHRLYYRKPAQPEEPPSG
jgi:hypothetical protein